MADFQQQLAKARLERQEAYFKKYPSKRPVSKKEPPAPVNASLFVKKDEENRTELDKGLERAQWKRRKDYENYEAKHAVNTDATETHPPHEALIASHPRAHILGTTKTDDETRKQLIHEISLQHAEKTIIACKKPEPPITQRQRMNEDVESDKRSSPSLVDDDNIMIGLGRRPREQHPVTQMNMPTVNEPIELPSDFEPTCFCLSVKHTKSVMLRICKHCFHKSCLLEWFKQNKTCPTCRCKAYLSPLEVSIALLPPQDTVNNMQQMQT
jgi:hypothetical protein